MLKSSNLGFKEFENFINVITFHFCSKWGLNISSEQFVRMFTFLERKGIANNAFTSRYLGLIIFSAQTQVWGKRPRLKINIKYEIHLAKRLWYSLSVTFFVYKMKIPQKAANTFKVRLWNVVSGVCLLVLNDHNNFARCISFTGNRYRVVKNHWPTIWFKWFVFFRKTSKQTIYI